MLHRNKPHALHWAKPKKDDHQWNNTRRETYSDCSGFVFWPLKRWNILRSIRVTTKCMMRVLEIIWNVLQTNANNTVRSKTFTSLNRPTVNTVNTPSGEWDRWLNGVSRVNSWKRKNCGIRDRTVTKTDKRDTWSVQDVLSEPRTIQTRTIYETTDLRSRD
jgi:hypothetical protein